MNVFKDKTILVTGAGGSLGSVLVEKLLNLKPKSIRALGHSELPLYNLVERVNHDPRVRPILRDVMDLDGMRMAMEGVEIVIHTAAVKSVDIAHYNALHAIRTNVDGTINIVKCALDSPCFERMIFISSDKACYPVSLYGATKMLGEGILNWAQSISKSKVFCCTRSGNFYGSLMSVLPLWEQQAKEGKPLTITDRGTKRYFIKINDMADFVLEVLSGARGGEIFIPRKEIMKEYRMVDLANKISKRHKIIGLRPGERLIEPLWTQEERSGVSYNGKFYTLNNPFTKKHY